VPTKQSFPHISAPHNPMAYTHFPPAGRSSRRALVMSCTRRCSRAPVERSFEMSRSTGGTHDRRVRPTSDRSSAGGVWMWGRDVEGARARHWRAVGGRVSIAQVRLFRLLTRGVFTVLGRSVSEAAGSAARRSRPRVLGGGPDPFATARGAVATSGVAWLPTSGRRRTRPELATASNCLPKFRRH